MLPKSSLAGTEEPVKEPSSSADLLPAGSAESQRNRCSDCKAATAFLSTLAGATCTRLASLRAGVETQAAPPASSRRPQSRQASSSCTLIVSDTRALQTRQATTKLNRANPPSSSRSVPFSLKHGNLLRSACLVTNHRLSTSSDQDATHRSAQRRNPHRGGDTRGGQTLHQTPAPSAASRGTGQVASAE